MTVVCMLAQEADGIPGFMAHPEGAGRRPGVLMVHHAHGVTAQGSLWQSFIANGRLVEWHFFSDANHGFRHPDNADFQPHYADLTWPLVTDFLQRTV